MPAHQAKLILNPSAGLGNAWKIARELRPVVNEFGSMDWAGTVYPAHATELAMQAASYA